LGGFISEWMLAMALAKGLTASQVSIEIVLLTALAALALTGGLGIIAYVRLVGLGMLGQNRNLAAFRPDIRPTWMIIAVCVAIPALVGILPEPIVSRLVTPEIMAKLGVLFQHSLPKVGILNGILIALSLLLLWVRTRAVQNRGLQRSPVWGCGYTAGTAEHQYTASGFGQPLDDVLPLSGQSKLEGAKERFPKRRRFVWNDVDGLAQKLASPSYLSLGNLGHRLHNLTGPQPLQRYISFAIWFILLFLVLTFLRIL
jgi:hypothetical protein